MMLFIAAKAYIAVLSDVTHFQIKAGPCTLSGANEYHRRREQENLKRQPETRRIWNTTLAGFLCTTEV
jgi:hypothetical protein